MAKQENCQRCWSSIVLQWSCRWFEPTPLFRWSLFHTVLFRTLRKLLGFGVTYNSTTISKFHLLQKIQETWQCMAIFFPDNSEQTIWLLYQGMCVPIHHHLYHSYPISDTAADLLFIIFFALLASLYPKTSLIYTFSDFCRYLSCQPWSIALRVSGGKGWIHA